MFDIKYYGPWVLIAGASEGVGAALAREVSALGCSVILVARNADALEELAAQLRGEFGVDVVTCAQDLLAPGAIDAVVDAAGEREVGLLVVNAGANTYRSEIVESDPNLAQRVIDLNISVPVELVRRFAPAMKSRGHGGVVLTGSLSQFAGAAGISFYSASKAFLHNLAEALWAELRPFGVNVLEICLGLTRTPAMERLGLDFDKPGVRSSDASVVAKEIVAAIGEGPLHVADGNEEKAIDLASFPRKPVIERSNAAFIAASQAKSPV